MKKLAFKLFGHKWRYHFGGCFGVPRTDIRVCIRTNKVQYLHIDPTKVINDGKPLWMNCVGYTDKGANEHYSEELLKD